jgi:citrate synthase
MSTASPNAPSTAIATSTTDQIIVRGKSLVDDLMGQVDFTTMICFHLGGGRMPEPGEVAVVNAVLVALMEHGLTPSAITTRLIYGSAPEAVQAAVAAGLLGAGSQFLGSTEDAARILQVGAAAVAAGETDVASYARACVDGYLESGRAMPGFGHHIHRPDDPRAPKLLAIAREHGVAGIHAEIVMALSAAMDEAKGRHVTVNATGAIAAVLSDVGYPADSLRGFSLIARAAGLVGHVMEEAERPTMRFLWDLVEREVGYDGPRP